MTPLYVVGAGGIGCVLGYALRVAGARVTFVESNPAKVRCGREHGVGVDRRPYVPAEFVAFDEWIPAAGATILLCTKCYDNDTVLSRLAGVDDIDLIPVQNGFDPSLEALDFVWEGIASFVSECIPQQTQTRITRGGKLHLGRRPTAARHANGKSVDDSARPEALELIQSGMRSIPGVQLVWVTDVLPYKYTKLMYNAAISPLAAAAGLDNGQLLSIRKARHLFFEQLRENYAILRAAGTRLEKIGPFHPDIVQHILRRPLVANALAWAFYPSLRNSYCSMSADLPAGRTEIDYYNRHLIDLAAGRSCPRNRRLYDLIKRMEQERIVPGPHVLNELL